VRRRRVAALWSRAAGIHRRRDGAGRQNRGIHLLPHCSPGLDSLLSSRQLLADVRIADIAQIGFSGQAKSPWTLQGYEIRINGRLLASNDAVAAAALLATGWKSDCFRSTFRESADRRPSGARGSRDCHPADRQQLKNLEAKAKPARNPKPHRATVSW